MDYAAAIAAVAWVLYHYLMNRAIRRTLQRIANAVENLEDLATKPGAQEADIQHTDQQHDQPPS